MISFQNDPSAQLLKSYPPPLRGTWKTLPPHLLPDDVLQDSLNVTLQAGRLRSRLGHKVYDPFVFPDPVIGSFMFIDSHNVKHPIVSTQSHVYRYDSGRWVDISSPQTFTAGATMARMTSIQSGLFVYLLYTNGIDPIRAATDTGPLQRLTSTNVFAGIPTFTDLCTAASRIIGISPPYTVAWCDVLNNVFLNFTSWPPLNQVILADTEDALVAVKPLGTLGFAIYKEGSIYTASPQAGPQSAAFRFDFRGEYQGPASSQAIVDWSGVHVYMTPSGRVGAFDGSNHLWIADGLWPFLQNTMDLNYTSKIFGVYNYLTSEIYFYYPRLGDNGAANGMLILDAPYPLAGLQDWSYFLGSCALGCTNGLSVRLFNAQTQPLLFSNQSGVIQTFQLDKNTYQDNAVDFPCSFKTGTFKAVDQAGRSRDNADIFRPIAELYVTRDSARGLAQLATLVSNNLETDGTAGVSEQLDLTQTPVNQFVGFDQSGSFLGISLNWNSSAQVEYKGCDVYGRRTQ